MAVVVALCLIPARAIGAPRRAPNGPPLRSGAAGFTAPPQPGDSEASFAQPSGAGDPLVDNGLGSPMCAGAGGLSTAALRNCRTSGFVAAAAPTANYGFDVYGGGGLLGLDPRVLLQEYLLAPVWTGLVWMVHALLVMLEWCYALDLLDSSATSGLGRGLRAMQATLTQPWLAVVLAVASVLALYHGLVRRQVAQTVGQALLMGAMMAGGLWVIANPTGTVGALGRWADQASLGTLGALAQGTPSGATRTLADSMRAVFADGIEAPWCYMEFGDVQWCRDPARLDPRLRAAGLRLAVGEQGLIGCRLNSSLLSICAPRGSKQAWAYSRSAELLRAARTNGELFLALPANAAPRNSTGGSSALLRVLCGSADIGACRGPTAAQAQFRAAGATEQRIAGELLILLGAAGMVLMLGFLVLHLLAAAIQSLLYLLLAPAAVLAPALGDGGRAAFRSWATRLLGAVVSKLLYSLLLGAMLAMVRILLSLQGLGWWTQWLLVSTLWWGAYRQRHQVLGFAQGEHRSAPAQRSLAVGARLREALPTPRQIARSAGWIRGKLSKPAPSVERQQAVAQAGRRRAQAQADEQVGQTLEREHGEARAQLVMAPQIQSRIASRQSQLERVRREQDQARQGGDTRRTARLGLRAQRIQGEIAHERDSLSAAQRTVADGKRAQRRGGQVYTREQHQDRARFLDAQAALTQGRDYAALAGLAGYGRVEYQRLDPRRRREARLEVDRELALRRELGGAAEDVAAGGGEGLGRREQRRVDRDFDRTLQQRLQDSGHGLPASRQKRPPPLDSWLAQARARPPAPARSPVMRDAHDVAQRRKRQLGWTARR